MDRINYIINELKCIADNPKKAMDDYKKATGKGAVGIMPLYCPEEIVHAAGYLPMGIWGGHRKISKSRAYLPPFACSIMQTVMEMQLDSVYDDLAAVIFSVPCDTLKCLSQKWKGTSPVIVFTHPQNRVIEASNAFLVEEFKILKARLEEILDTKISDESITESIRIYNENRQVMREFTQVAAKYPHIIDAVTRHSVIKARFFMEKSSHTALVKELLAEIRQLDPKPWTGKKVILTGIMAEPNEMLDILNEFDMAVVADDLAQESRQFRVDVPDGDDPLYRLAKWWQDFYGCALATDVKKYRGEMLINMVKEQQADGVIVCMMKFCDPEEFDYPIYYDQFQQEGIRSISIEIDQESQAFEQIKTRLQSFSELL